MSFTFTSCSKDDEVVTPESLVGTTWVVSAEGMTITLTFSTSTYTGVMTYPGDPDESMTNCLYTYVSHVIILADENDMVWATGKVDGNKMTLTDGEYEVVLTMK
ncbi:MAG: hypothetical protein LBT27_03480 [Prevotellaceae bacterium]|nr:hypothetical protein [Prevotellaceae bacterium]